MRLFVSYRRQDTEGYVGAMALAIQQQSAPSPVELFVDSDKIAAGTDFVRAMLAAVKSCDAVLVCIGPRWEGPETATSRPRLFAEDDPVRLELRTALSSGIPMFVVLLNGATAPKKSGLPGDLAALTSAPALVITDSNLEGDVVQMVGHIRSIVRPPDRAPLAPAKLAITFPRGKYWSSIELLIDGKSAGRFMPKTNRAAEFAVAPGNHTVQARVDSFKSNALTVDAQAGRTVEIVYTPGLLAWQIKLALAK